MAAHRSTLIFVPSRRLAERLAHDLEPLIGDGLVSAHHGALSKRTRLLVERRLQTGELRAVVATASLELGIDVGHVDLVCQIGSPRAISVLRQRIGRARHTVGGTPKGRIFAMTRDELLECMAGVHAMREGTLDRPVVRDAPLDILAQQLVATASASDWQEDALFDLCRGAAPYATLTRARFDAVLSMLGDGIATRRGRIGAHLHLDRIAHRVRGRRGSRLAALTSAGAIPDKADYTVIEEPSDSVVGTVDEDFAIDSMSGDVFLLGSNSWRIRRVVNGQVRVEDAHGLPPSVPFWNGEGLARTAELSLEVSRLRETLAAYVRRIAAGEPEVAHEAIDWMQAECAVDTAGATQALDYISEGMSALGSLPSCGTLVAERFFDESGGMQLVLHAPLGARVNRAWGMALRKSFCRSFDFELQAAATDDAVLLSLGPQHSFPLISIFEFVRSVKAREVLEQAILQSPLWETRWRWNSTRSLAVLRFQGGRRTPPALLRMKAADLLAAVFPAQAGCQDNHGGGDVELPDHPLVHETMDDCLFEAMDLDGFVALLSALEAGEVSVEARDTVTPSVFAHAILNANPYAFLDDAPLEERRSRAVQTGKRAARDAKGLVRADHLSIDPAAIAAVLEEVVPDPRDPDELHDLLLSTGVVKIRSEWLVWFEVLRAERRATAFVVEESGFRCWVATERMGLVQCAYAGALFIDTRQEERAALPAFDSGTESATAFVLAAYLRTVGPQSQHEIAAVLHLPPSTISVALAQLELDGQVLQGQFRPGIEGIEWCERGLLQRIHRRTLGRRRASVQAVPQSALYRFLTHFQHVAPGTQLRGIDGLRSVIEQLEGIEVPAAAWERDILSSRVVDYDPRWLDELCLSGELAWGRLRITPPEGVAQKRSFGAYGASGAIALFLRAHGSWLVGVNLGEEISAPSTWAGLSPMARCLAAYFERRGAAFLSDLDGPARELAVDATERAQLIDDAMWELVRHGVLAADGFDGLRALLSRRRKSALDRAARSVGRWSLIHRDVRPRAAEAGAFGDGSPVEHAWMYLRRYGIVTRDLLVREVLAPSWRSLAEVYRRLEARGEIRGGRFVTGVRGEQFALPEALELLSKLAHTAQTTEVVSLSAADPLNLLGILTPGPRCSPLSSEVLRIENGLAAHV